MMASNLSLLILTKEQLGVQYEHEKLEAGNTTDYCNLVHEGYPWFWMGPRIWFHEQFMSKVFSIGDARIVPKGELLKMLPLARNYVKNPEEEFEPDVIESVLNDYNMLEMALSTFNEDTHVLVGYVI